MSYAPRSHDTELWVHCLQLVGIRTHYSLQTQLRGTYYQRRINSGPRRLITRERFGLGLDDGRSASLLVSGQPAGHCWRSRRVSGDVTCRQCDRSQCRAPVCMAFPPLPPHLLPRAGPPSGAHETGGVQRPVCGLRIGHGRTPIHSRLTVCGLCCIQFVGLISVSCLLFV